MVCLFKLCLHSLIHPFVLFYISFPAFLVYLPLSSHGLALSCQPGRCGTTSVDWVRYSRHMVTSNGHKSQVFRSARLRVLQILKESSMKVKFPLLFIGFHAKAFHFSICAASNSARHPCASWLLLSTPICVNINAALNPTSSFVAKRWNGAIHQEYQEPFSSVICLAYPFYTYPGS